MRQITITGISGATYPINVYVSDINGNNQSFLGVITTPPPPDVNYNVQIPPILNTADEVLVTMVDSVGTRFLEILKCQYFTPTATPTPTLTPGLPPPSQTPTPSITPTITTTPTVTVTPSVTPTITRTNTPTPSITPTNTPTPSITPSTSQPEPLRAYIFAEPQDSTSDLELLSYAASQGANDWYSWYGNGVPNNNSGNYSNDLNIYAHQPNFISGNGLYLKPVDLSEKIAKYQGEIIDGLSQNIYTFGSITIELSGDSLNTLYFYSIWVPLNGVGGTMSGMTIDVGTSKGGTEVYDSLPAEPQTLSYNVSVTSGAAIPQNTYRVLWISPQMQLPAQLPLNVILYIRGDRKF